MSLAGLSAAPRYAAYFPLSGHFFKQLHASFGAREYLGIGQAYTSYTPPVFSFLEIGWTGH